MLQAWDQLHKLDRFDPPLLSPSLTPLHHTASLYSSIRSLLPRTIDADSNTRLLHALLLLFQLASLETLGASPSATYQAHYLSLAARNVADVLSWAGFTGHEYSEACTRIIDYVAPLTQLTFHGRGPLDITNDVFVTRRPPASRAKGNDAS